MCIRDRPRHQFGKGDHARQRRGGHLLRAIWRAEVEGERSGRTASRGHRRCARGHWLRAALVTQPKHNGCDPETTALYGLVEPTAAWSRGEAYLLLRRAFEFNSSSEHLYSGRRKLFRPGMAEHGRQCMAAHSRHLCRLDERPGPGGPLRRPGPKEVGRQHLSLIHI